MRKFLDNIEAYIEAGADLEALAARSGLSTEEVSALEARTEGWIVALQLMATAAGDKHEIDELLAATQSRRGWLAEYLDGSS